MKIKAESMAELKGMGFDEDSTFKNYPVMCYGELNVARVSRSISISVKNEDDCNFIEVSDKALNKYYDLIKADMIEE